MKRLLALATLLWVLWLVVQFATQKEMDILIPLYGLAFGLIAFTILWGLYAAWHAKSPIGRKGGLAAAILTVLVVGGLWGAEEFQHWRYRYPGVWVDKSEAQLLPVGEATAIAVPAAGKGSALVKVLPERRGIYTVEVLWKRTGPDAGAPRSGTQLFWEDGLAIGVQPGSSQTGSLLWAEVPADAGEAFYVQLHPLTWAGKTDTSPNEALITVTFREIQQAP